MIVSDYFASNGVFVFTSACKGEGKSTKVSSIGEDLCNLGKTVLVIDCDLRGSGYLEPLRGMFGYLYGGRRMETVLLQPRSFPIIYAGFPSRPLDKIFHIKDSKNRFASLIQDVRKRYSYVLIDTPPLGIFDDALEIAEFSDGIVLIKDPDRPSGESDLRLAERLKMSPVPVIGTIPNKKIK